jgi:hypothetical protein
MRKRQEATYGLARAVNRAMSGRGGSHPQHSFLVFKARAGTTACPDSAVRIYTREEKYRSPQRTKYHRNH